MFADHEPIQVRAEKTIPADDGLVQVRAAHTDTIGEAIPDTVLSDIPEQNATQPALPGFDHTGFSPEFHQTFLQDEIYENKDDNFRSRDNDNPIQVRPASIGPPGEPVPDAVLFDQAWRQLRYVLHGEPGHGAREQFPSRQTTPQHGIPIFEQVPQNRDPLPTRWVPSSETVTIAGREIRGMIYTGPSDIDPSLHVSPNAVDKRGKTMPYWPKYKNILPQSRATYLDFLASDRADSSYDAGYMFLYFYGLERRFLKDNPPEHEKREILEEVKRLKNVYSNSYSVQNYLRYFIQLAQFILNDKITREPFSNYNGYPGMELPLWLKLTIGKQVGQNLPLSAEQMLDWLLYHPDCRLRTPATRCNNEFRALFTMYFNDQIPDGLKIDKPHGNLEYSYKAASNEFRWNFRVKTGQPDIPDISELTRPVAIAQEIANIAMMDLENFSRYFGRNPEGRDNIEAHLLLPWQLREKFPCRKLEHFKIWIENIIEAGGPVSVPDIIERIDGNRPSGPTRANLARLADLLEKINYGFSPDPRYGLRIPKTGEPVVLFHLDNDRQHSEEVSDLYHTALLKAALGAFVAHADGKITGSERKSILATAQATDGLSMRDHCHLAGNIRWMLEVMAPDLPLLKRMLKKTGSETRTAFRTAMITTAHADGMIQAEEVTAIEKIYKALELDISLVYSDLHAGETSGGPATGHAGQTATNGSRVADLDTTKIAAIQSDTARASSMLGDIFDEPSRDSPKESRADFPEPKTDHTYPNGLDAEHWHLVQALITREHWTENEFRDLCGKAGFMVSAAVEDLNEWAYETFNEPLLDEYDGYEILSGPAGQLKELIERNDLAMIGQSEEQIEENDLSIEP